MASKREMASAWEEWVRLMDERMHADGLLPDELHLTVDEPMESAVRRLEQMRDSTP